MRGSSIWRDERVENPSPAGNGLEGLSGIRESGKITQQIIVVVGGRTDEACCTGNDHRWPKQWALFLWNGHKGHWSLRPSSHHNILSLKESLPVRVFSNPSFQFFTVELTLSTRVLLFGVRVVEESGAALFSEEFCQRSVSTDFHGAELVKLPRVEIGRSIGEYGSEYGRNRD